MKKPSYYFLSFMALLFTLLCIEISYMYKNSATNQEIKKSFVKLSGLPDLAISNETLFVRFRSYSDVFSIFSNSPELLEYFPSTFVYNYTKNNNPSRIELAK